ncbi:MAG: PorT family protein [Hymenobacter sp.]|nr:MAG: PorT family protein [Hymenobacter sp.]
MQSATSRRILSTLASKLHPQLPLSPRESQQLRKEGYGFDDYYTPTHTYLLHDYRVSLSFLNVPVLVRRTFGPVYVEAGPQGSVLVGGRGRGETRSIGGQFGYVTREDINQAATSYFNRVEAGVCVGVGLRLPAGWGVSLRAYQGLTPLTPDPHGYQYASEVLPPSGTEYRRVAQVAITRDLWGPGGALH